MLNPPPPPPKKKKKNPNSGRPKRVPRTPIIVTGNDLSTLFAPLLRDGRMDKFYWNPTREDLVNIVWQMIREDGVSREEVGLVLDAFPGQSLDFYGAMRASVYDAQIRRWIAETVKLPESDATAEINDLSEANMSELCRRLVLKEDLPTFEALDLTLDDLLAEGRRLAREQDFVNTQNLAKEYLKNMDDGSSAGGLLGLQGDYVEE